MSGSGPDVLVASHDQVTICSIKVGFTVHAAIPMKHACSDRSIDTSPTNN